MFLSEEIEEIDNLAKNELDGNLSDEELNLDLGIDKSELNDAKNEPDDETKNIDDTNPADSIEAPVQEDGYQISNVRDQLNGMVEKWFQLAKNLDPSKKEAFLKLGDRLSEITDVIESEFMNA